jgi:hypothetical protein
MRVQIHVKSFVKLTLKYVMKGYVPLLNHDIQNVEICKQGTIILYILRGPKKESCR